MGKKGSSPNKKKKYELHFAKIAVLTSKGKTNKKKKRK